MKCVCAANVLFWLATILRGGVSEARTRSAVYALGIHRGYTEWIGELRVSLPRFSVAFTVCQWCVTVNVPFS